MAFPIFPDAAECLDSGVLQRFATHRLCYFRPAGQPGYRTETYSSRRFPGPQRRRKGAWLRPLLDVRQVPERGHPRPGNFRLLAGSDALAPDFRALRTQFELLELL